MFVFKRNNTFIGNECPFIGAIVPFIGVEGSFLGAEYLYSNLSTLLDFINSKHLKSLQYNTAGLKIIFLLQVFSVFPQILVQFLYLVDTSLNSQHTQRLNRSGIRVRFHKVYPIML